MIIYQNCGEEIFIRRRGFGTLNISAKSAIDIYSYVAKITEDFLNEYNPDILMMTHTSKSRFNINWKFMENLNIVKIIL
jgi:hypothetical protein